MQTGLYSSEVYSIKRYTKGKDMRFDGVFVDTEGNIILLQRIVCKKKWKWTSKHFKFVETEAYIVRLRRYMKLKRIGDYLCNKDN